MDKTKILVVEDEQINIELICEALDDRYNIKVAKNGLDGLKVYRNFEPEIIIVDINMPIFNGLDMVKEIRINDKNTKIIFLTSHTEIDYLLKATELNLTKYLIKPIDKKTLIQALEKAGDDNKKYRVISNEVLIINETTIWNFNTKELLVNDKVVKFTKKEREIFEYLLSNKNVIKSQDDIIVNTYSLDKMTTKDSLKSIIYKLRKKLPDNLLESIYNEGYRINIK